MGLIQGSYFGGEFAVLKSSMFDGLRLDAGPLAKDAGCSAQFGVLRHKFVQALEIAVKPPNLSDWR